MRPALALLAFLAFVFLGAPLAAPWVQEGLQAAGFPNIPFRRVVSRCLMIFALIGLWPLMKALEVRSLREAGLGNHPRWATDLAAGLLVGWGLLALAGGLCLLVGAAELDDRVSVIAKLPSAASSAIAVAFLEEVLFRGAIMTAFCRVWGPATGLWTSSALYAILHFFSRPADPPTIDWQSGFFVLGGMLQGFIDFQQVIPGFLSLTLLGVILGLAFRKTKALYMSMGIHAGIVFGAKLFAAAANSAPLANVWLWGTEKLIDGWFAFLLLVGVTIGFMRWRSKIS
jgi:membrane protease YdiL (CAAX protease family)